MRFAKRFAISLGMLFMCGLLPDAALAHKLLVSAVVEGRGDLKVQAFFPDGNPAQEIPVTAAPADGSPPLTGKTDTQGICRFTGLKPGTYSVSAGDPLGHRGETKVAIPGAAPTASPRTPETAVPAPGSDSPAPTTPATGEPLPWNSILAGLGFIFGLSAFVMVLKLKADLRRYASRD